MATDKRERQRANREEKRAAEAKAAKRQKLFGQVRKYSLYAAAFIIAFVLLQVFFT